MSEFTGRETSLELLNRIGSKLDNIARAPESFDPYNRVGADCRARAARDLAAFERSLEQTSMFISGVI